MARDESDREDLLREATALVERIELVPIVGDAVPIVIGFRASGAISFFFGVDPVYQFNAAGSLRRAYCGGLLFKAVHGRLFSLERVRSANQVELRRRDLSDIEQDEFLNRLRKRQDDLAVLLAENKATIVGQVPAGRDVLGRVKKWLALHQEITVAAAPNA